VVGFAAAPRRLVPVLERLCCLAIIRWPVSGARKRATGGGQSDKRAISGFGLASLSFSQGGVATSVEPGSGPPLTVSSHWSIRVPYRGGRPLACMVSNYRRMRSEADVYGTSMVQPMTGHSVGLQVGACCAFGWFVSVGASRQSLQNGGPGAS